MADQPLRCPEAGCTGWVSEVEDEGFWGCGECGMTWDEREELDDAIQEAIETYPYRKKVYRKTKNGWQPVAIDDEPEDYEELVDEEEIE